MGIFTASFTDVAVSAAQDVFELVAPASRGVALRRVVLGQHSLFGDSNDDLLGVQIIIGYTTAGSGGSAVTPVNLFQGGGSALSTVKANNTTEASTGTPSTLWSDVWNNLAGFVYPPPRPAGNASGASGLCAGAAGLIVISAGTRLVVRQTAPAASMTMNGLIEFEELAP